MSGPSFIIRSASHDDLPPLLALYQQFIPEDPVLDQGIAETRFAEILTQPGMTLFCGFWKNQLVSTCTLIIIPNLTRNASPYAFIENVVTDGAFRRQGFGKKLIQNALELGFENGCYKIMLLATSHDPGVLKFYLDCGFQQSKTGFEIRNPEKKTSDHGAKNQSRA